MSNTSQEPPIVRSVLSALVPAEGKRFNVSLIFLPLAIIAIYSMIIPIFILDVWVSIYQAVYFSVMGIPKIKKNEYVKMERWDFTKLSLWQKVNCVYCEYANGILAYAKAIANQTEIYSCAIRHRQALKGHDHEKEFYPAEKFE